MIREELKSHTLLSQTQQSFQKQEKPSDPNPPRRSARLSKIYSDETIVASGSHNVSASPQSPPENVPWNCPSPSRRPKGRSRYESVSSPFSQEDLGTTVVQSSPKNKCHKPLKRSEAINITAAHPPVRRSTRLSVVPRPIYFNDTSSPLMKKPHTQSRKAARFSSRLSLMPQETAGISINRM